MSLNLRSLTFFPAPSSVIFIFESWGNSFCLRTLSRLNPAPLCAQFALSLVCWPPLYLLVAPGTRITTRFPSAFILSLGTRRTSEPNVLDLQALTTFPEAFVASRRFLRRSWTKTNSQRQTKQPYPVCQRNSRLLQSSSPSCFAAAVLGHPALPQEDKLPSDSTGPRPLFCFPFWASNLVPPVVLTAGPPQIASRLVKVVIRPVFPTHHGRQPPQDYSVRRGSVLSRWQHCPFT